MAQAAVADTGFGPLLRSWRQARRLSQEELAFAAEVSARHISFLENSKSAPSRQMVLVLASALDLPLRERNLLLASAGFAAVYRESPLGMDASSPVRRTLDLILGHHEPYPAVAVTPSWDLVQLNATAARLFPQLMDDPADPQVAQNVMHAAFSPKGFRGAIVNWEEVSRHLLERMHRDAVFERESGTQRELLSAIAKYPEVPGRFEGLDPLTPPDVCLPVHVKKGDLELRLFTTLTTLGTPTDVTAQELWIESYFPADDATDRRLRELSSD